MEFFSGEGGGGEIFFVVLVLRSCLPVSLHSVEF